MSTTLLRRTLLLLGFLIIFAGYSRAQTLQEMTVNIFNDTYTTVSGLNSLGAGDDGVWSWTIPFSFKWDNVWNTTVYFGDNGLVCFTPYNNVYYYWSTYLTDIWPSIQVMRTDLYVNSDLQYGVTGTAPNRVIVFQWINVDFYYGYGYSMNFQVKLYETSNKVEIVYGSMSGSGNYYYTNYSGVKNGFVGSSNTSYINIEPGTNFVAHFSSKNPAPNNNLPYITSHAAWLNYTNGKTIQLTAFPSIVGTWPSDGMILRKGNIYDQPGARPAVLFNRITGQANVYSRYKISGPLPASDPDFKAIYTGTNLNTADELILFNPQPVGQPGTANIPYAKGYAAGTGASLDLSTNSNRITGGEYIVEANMELPSFNYIMEYPTQIFFISLDDDIAITNLTSPISKDSRKYPMSSFIPVQFRVKNIGINTVYEFEATAVFYLNGVEVYRDYKHWPTNPNDSLPMGTYVDIQFNNFRPRDVGDYEVIMQVNLLSAIDQNPLNNRFPRATQPDFFFRVAHEIEAEALSIPIPGDSVYVGRPVLPRGRFQNNGVSDISDVPVKMWIVKQFPPYDTVYNESMILQDIPAGKINYTDAYFTVNFVPPVAGRYQACISVNSPDDPITTNNVYCKYFEVIDAMRGTFTIGTAYANGSRNFNTFQDALNALYLRGVSGPVTFELTDARYDIGDINNTSVPIDLSSRIIGGGANNPILFKPSNLRAINRAGITINLYSNSGIGILFGQNTLPTNTYAAVYGATSGMKKKFANSEGYITFDGGTQKVFKFVLNSPSPFRAVFDIAQGASNITVKNCIIQDASPSCSVTIPLTRYDALNSKFVFQSDIRTGNVSYSAGILLRSIVPLDKGTDNMNTFKLDTLASQNVLISNNEISGFGYGIVSLGIGPLFDAGREIYKHYYNNNNVYEKNLITNAGRAGFFIGYEENSKIQYNRIFNVTGQCGLDACGIILGGEGTSSYLGYNNMDILVNGNEMSNLNSTMMITGIRVEHTRNAYPYTNPTQYYLPDRPENVWIINNTIWGFNPGNSYTDRVGIHVFTQRENQYDWLYPKYLDYMSRNDKVINNSIRIQWDGGYMNTGAVLGVAFHQLSNPEFYNNAIAIEDVDIHEDNQANAFLFFEGMNPKTGALTGNMNAFWAPALAKTDIVRFIEMDNKNEFLDYGSKGEYQYLEQWQTWTGQELNSVFGNFTGDWVVNGTEPNQKLRVRTVPQPPMGSLLSNRGKIFSWFNVDIDAAPRGPAQQPYDLGAHEFGGRQYISDLEAILITTPSAYKVTRGIFADAEYIMTKAPIEVKALVRNNGNILQSGVPVTINIFRELPDGSFSNSAEVSKTIVTGEVGVSETVELNFNLGNGDGDDFYPLSYSDLRDHIPPYVVPDTFSTMTPNVTPRYRFVINIEMDQNNTNNTITDTFRFYLLRTPLRFLISAENSMAFLHPNSSQDAIAGFKNYEAVIKGLNKMGWKIDLESDPPIYDFDVFDRLGWEPRAVNYENYRTVLWSDGDDKPVTRYQRTDLRNLLNLGNEIEKRNLIIGSQEMVRLMSLKGTYQDMNFVNEILRADNKQPENPRGAGVSNDGNRVRGVGIAKGLTDSIKATRYANDADPYCGLMGVYGNGEGLALPAYYYLDHSGAPSDSITGVATTTLLRNVVILGVDWRHWGDITHPFRGVFDWTEKNGSQVIPVELLSLNAVPANNQINISWATASEFNSDRFDVERSKISESGRTEFIKITEAKAAGISTDVKHYGPLADKDVAAGIPYIYRLKMVNTDGTWKYSNEVIAGLDADNSDWLDAVKPNPVEDGKIIDITYNLKQAGNIQLGIFNINGKDVTPRLDVTGNKGLNTVKLNTAELSNGNYTIILKVGESTFTRQLNVIR